MLGFVTRLKMLLWSLIANVEKGLEISVEKIYMTPKSDEYEIIISLLSLTLK